MLQACALAATSGYAIPAAANGDRYRAGAPADEASYGPSISPDGRYVTFGSFADNLSAEDFKSNPRLGSADVFLRDLSARTTTLVSRQSRIDGGRGGENVVVDFGHDAVANGGSRVVFRSAARNLVREPLFGPAIFMRDTLLSQTTVVSRASTASGEVFEVADHGTISDDGSVVAFDAASNGRQVMVRDLASSTTQVVSRQSESIGGAIARGDAAWPALSGDGRHVAFLAHARNLGSADAGRHPNVYVYDRETRTLELASRQSPERGGRVGDGRSSKAPPAISSDGRFVAFASQADNLSGIDRNVHANVFLHDRRTRRTELISRNSDGRPADGNSGDTVSVSRDGRYVAFRSFADNLSAHDANKSWDIFVRDRRTKRTILVSRQSAERGGRGAEGHSAWPSISDDGRYVAFESEARNLGRVARPAWLNVFVRDLRTRRTILVSRQSAPRPGVTAAE